MVATAPDVLHLESVYVVAVRLWNGSCLCTVVAPKVTVQPCDQSVADVGVIVTFELRLMASLRAISSAFIISVVADFTRWPLMKERKDGTPTPISTARIVSVTISSLRWKPRLRVLGAALLPAI